MSLQVQHLSKRYAGRAVVRGVSFHVDDGELVALLGPSGSGKSTVLRIIAGLTQADEGTVLVDGEDVTNLPPKARDLGFVFQNYALFEHLSVADNVEFALRVRGDDRRTRQARRDELLELVGLGGSARKFPSQLSGGQRQRTALARALAHRPRLLLLDEPFGALDARIRQELRQGLRELLRQVGTTAIFVTHDQEEAFAVADRILVLHRGRLLEEGPPRQLYQTPQTEFVAGFVGRANLLPGELTPHGARIRLHAAQAAPDAIPGRVKVLVRPEKLWLLKSDAPLPEHPEVFAHQARVQRVDYLGAGECVHLALESDDDARGSRRYLLEAMRSTDTAQWVPLRAGDTAIVVAQHFHAIPQPDLRILVLADGDDAGRALTETALAYGERTHALITVLGGAVRDTQLHARLEHYRQSFAGDLRLYDTQALGLWQAASSHVDGEPYDLALVSASLRQSPALIDFLRQRGAPQQVMLAAACGNPLALTSDARWSLLLHAFASSQPDLDLLAELAGEIGAQVEVHDLGAAQRPVEGDPRWGAALALRSVAFTIARAPRQTLADACTDLPVDASADLVALDLGPRASLGPHQQPALRALNDHWALLIVQPDESDLGLLPITEFRREQPTPAAQSHVSAEDGASPDTQTHTALSTPRSLS